MPEILEELVDRLRVLGHPPLEDAIGVRFVAQELCLLGAKGQDLGQDLLVVELVAVVTAHDVGVEDLLAELAVVGVVEEGIDARPVGGEEPLALLARLRRRIRRALDDAGRKTGEVLFVVDEELVLVGFGEDIVAKAQTQCRQIGVDLPQAFLVGFGELGAAIHEIEIGLLQEPHLLRVELELVPLLVDRFDTLEELRVHEDVVAEGRAHRRHLLGDRLNLVVGLRTGQGVENAGHLVHQLPGGVQCLESVFKGRCLRVLRDGLDLRTLFGNGPFEGRQVVLFVDLAPRWNTERGRPLGEERILEPAPCLHNRQPPRQHRSRATQHFVSSNNLHGIGAGRRPDDSSDGTHGRRIITPTGALSSQF